VNGFWPSAKRLFLRVTITAVYTIVHIAVFGFLLTGAVLAQTQLAAGTTSQRLKILVVHGPNLNLLGRREPAIYGSMTLADINDRLRALAQELNVELVIVQSNHNGDLIDAFQAHIDDADGAILNAAGDSFHSVGLHDVIKAVPYPTIEVHLTNLGTRDAIHQNSLITPAARGTIMGLGWRSYTMALRAVVEIAREEKQRKR
jgi:3-dehydroquinate dehydratase-2